MKVLRCTGILAGSGALLLVLTGCPRTNDRPKEDVRSSTRESYDANNTGRNANDPGATPLDQGTSEADVTVTQQIRQALMDDETLSMTDKNVKVITREGNVTLRGPVTGTIERARIEGIAQRIAGTGKVMNQLEVEKSKS